MSSALCLVLHAHQPYVRRHGSWPCGEDWYHQAATEAYLPLAEAFTRLADDGLSGFATVSFTPVLAGQMADPYLTRELRLFLGRTMLRAERQVANYRGPWRDELVSLAAGAHVEAGALEARLGSEWAAGSHVPWRALAAAGAIETWTSAPTHAFLPGLRDDALAAAGWRAAAGEHERVFGIRPAGAWLPECGYRPGLEAGPAAAGLGTILVDEPALGEGGDPLTPVRVSSGVRAVVRDRARSLLVSGPGGYPGGAAYRDFHHYDDEAGFKSFAVTRPPGEGGPKHPYDPAAGAAAALQDAGRFAGAVREALAAHRSRTGRDGLLVAAFDLELFGHWWFEGPAFLEAVIRELSADGDVRPVTVSEGLASVPAADAGLGASTWGRDGDDSSWLNAATAPVWGRVWEGEARVREALAGGGDPEVLAQAVREMLLLASSDWPFMISMGRAADYARDRAAAHDRALHELCDAALRGEAPPGLDALRERDNLLPALDLAPFAETARS